jgi:hypothetical protein
MERVNADHLLFSAEAIWPHLLDQTGWRAIEGGPDSAQQGRSRLVMKRNDNGRGWQLVHVKNKVLAVLVASVFDVTMKRDAVALKLVEVIGSPLCLVLRILLLFA